MTSDRDSNPLISSHEGLVTEERGEGEGMLHNRKEFSVTRQDVILLDQGVETLATSAAISQIHKRVKVLGARATSCLSLFSASLRFSD